MNHQIGLGYRKEIHGEIMDFEEGLIDFIEIAPENWINLGGYWRKKLKAITEKYPLNCHGLSLSIGSPEELNWDFLKDVKVFLKECNIQIYSEHLSFSSTENAHLYDLLPIPFRKDAVKHISEKIHQVQDFLEMPLTLENVSYYTSVGAEMSEVEFINEIFETSGCRMLLDVNNVYVNSFNHSYKAEDFITNLDLSKVQYIHMAGHTQVSDTLIIDTHGEEIIDPVYDLFEFTMKKLPPMQILLERDFNFPEISILKQELQTLREIAERTSQKSKKHEFSTK